MDGLAGVAAALLQSEINARWRLHEDNAEREFTGHTVESMPNAPGHADLGVAAKRTVRPGFGTASRRRFCIHQILKLGCRRTVKNSGGGACEVQSGASGKRRLTMGE